MDEILKYWAPIALIITLIGGFGTALMAAWNKRLEIKLEHQTRLKYELAKKFIQSYKIMHTEVRMLDFQMRLESVDVKLIQPVLVSYNIAFQVLATDAELVKFMFPREIGKMVQDMIDLINSMALEIVPLIIQRIRDQNNLNPENLEETVEIYKKEVDKKLPRIPVLAEKLFSSLSEELKFK